MFMTFTDFVTMNPIVSSATAHHKTQLPGLWILQDKIIQRLRLIWIGRIWIHFLVKNVQHSKLNREMN